MTAFRYDYDEWYDWVELRRGARKIDVPADILRHYRLAEREYTKWRAQINRFISRAEAKQAREEERDRLRNRLVIRATSPGRTHYTTYPEGTNQAFATKVVGRRFPGFVIAVVTDKKEIDRSIRLLKKAWADGA